MAYTGLPADWNSVEWKSAVLYLARWMMVLGLGHLKAPAAASAPDLVVGTLASESLAV